MDPPLGKFAHKLHRTEGQRKMTRQTWPPAVAALIGAVLCATLLHLAADRRLVAAVVPLAWLWGGAVVLLARQAPPLRHVIAAAALTRWILVGVPPWLSDDLFRYLWEGQALLAGHNPLYESPATLAALDPALAARVNHPDLPSVYPPLALAWFAGMHALGGTVAVAQALTAVADLVVVAALSKLRPQAGWLYALLPLPVLESAAGAHIDVPAVALTTVALVVWQRRPAAGWALLFAGALTKLFPLVVLPTVWRAASRREQVLWPALSVGVGLALLTPLLELQVPPGLLAYSTQWSFNGLVHTPLAALLGSTARPVLVGAGLAIGGLTVWRARTPVAAWAAVGVAFVALSPTMHPWYTLWALVPALALGIRGAAAAAVFVPGSYLVLATYDPATGAWSEGGWLWAITWLPVLGCLGWGQWTGRAQPAASPPEPEPR
jgi:hypothetical protein